MSCGHTDGISVAPSASAMSGPACVISWLQYKMYGQHGKAGHNVYHALLAEGKPEKASLLPYFSDTFQYKMYGQHGKAGHDAYHALLAEGKQEEASLLPYFQDTLQYEMYGQQGKAGHDVYHALLAEGQQDEASLLPFLQRHDPVREVWPARQGGVR